MTIMRTTNLREPARRWWPSVARAALLGLCLSVPFAFGVERGTSAAGVVFASGGSSREEQDMLVAERLRYSFWLTTAARRSGAYLAGVRVRVTEADGGKRVLEDVMDGPWLFADLPLGRYEVEAILLHERTGRLEIQRGTTHIHAGDHHRMVLYFSTGDDVGEEQAPK
jgi:hypothetical protein